MASQIHAICDEVRHKHHWYVNFKDNAGKTQMKIELSMNEDARAFLEGLKKKHNEIVVPLASWNAYIRDNPRIKVAPAHMISGAYVITEREQFDALDRGRFYYAPKRLPKEQGGFWFAEKLEPKKRMPKHDIFDVGLRQPGSFRSNG